MRKQEKKVKKALFVIAEYSSFRTPISEALSNLGISIEFFDYRKTTLLEKLFFAFSLIIPSTYSFAINLINKRLINKANILKPDLVLVSKGENLEPNTIKLISKISKIVNWYTDDFYDSKKIIKLIKAYDLFFTGDRSDVKEYRKKGLPNLYCLPYAGPIIKKIPDRKKYDVVFVGRYNKDREKLFENLTQFNFRIWGDQKWNKSKLKNSFTGEWLSYDENLKTLAESKIVVNQHQNKVLNLRVYEATAARALIITDNCPDLSLSFNIGKEVIVYKNKKDLINKIRYFLKHDDLREKIATAGYKRCVKDHNYDKRLKAMFYLVNTIN